MVEVVRGMRICCGEPDGDLEGGSEFKSGGIIGAAQGAEYKGYVGYAKNRGGMGIGDQRMAWLRVVASGEMSEFRMQGSLVEHMTSRNKEAEI